MSNQTKQQNRAFQLLLSISSMTKLADLLVSPKTTLPYILTAIGAPQWLISLLVPIKESGSLIPQWFLKSTVSQRFNNRTSFWRIGAMTQGVGILTMVAVMLLIDGKTMAICVLGILMLVAFGRSICSLTMKEIQAESVSKGRRGRLIGLASSLSGGLTLGSALVFLFSQQSLTQALSYGLLITGGFLFIGAMLLSIPLSVKYDVEEDSEQNMTGQLWSLMRRESNLRHIVISRILLMHSALIVPFVVAQSSAQEQGSSDSQLPYFIALSAFASLISSYVWGLMSDKSALLTLRVSATVCILAAFAVGFGLGQLPGYVNLLLFFVLTIGHAGIRTGRKTYLLDITERSNRAGYVAAANTIVGISLLIIGSVYAFIFNSIGTDIVVVMACMLVVGLLHTIKLQREK